MTGSAEAVGASHGHLHHHRHPHGQQSEYLPRDAHWHRAATLARRLSFTSVVLVALEGALGLWQGLSAGSVALTGWALGSIPEGLAGAMVIWRFTGSRTLSDTAERRAQIGVALSFWLSAPYIAAESLNHLFGGRHSEATLIGIAVTGASAVVMPVLGRAQRNVGIRLDSAATVGESIQNYLCAIQAAAVLVGLVVAGHWAGVWWLDPAIGLAIATVAVRQGFRSWRGEGCGC